MGTSGGRYNPWRELRMLDELIYEQTDLPSGDAWWVPAHNVILMRPGLKQVQRRCALAHELGHRELGHTGQCNYADASRQGARAEADADAWAARKLITVEQLADVLVWTDDRNEAASELWVTRRILDRRLEYMHLGERLMVRDAVRRREAHDDGRAADGEV
ncbi:ImmA/IrrE family metallo-endopeptidase [Nocardioides lijunqiniae]|uniref:ImmA/IrrE family metallo-endopeptidase n=1 Tax=Nocardioides lijunqiniae TaxID=2760832 RepID=UPI001878938F|nr:ImmA/IrrE family metallo-endopeptidase [Nocardioides lijunqiniae]